MPGPSKSLSFANVVSVIALFVALGGSSYAAMKVTGKQIADNSVRSADLRNNDVRGKDIRKNAVTGSDVKNGSLQSADFGSGQLPRGAQGLQGVPGASVFAGAVPRGTTVRGVFDISGADRTAAVSLPVPATSGLTSQAVNFAADASSAPIASDDDPTCTGTSAAPTAPPGKVCLYVSSNSGLFAEASAGQSLADSRFGFSVFAQGNNPVSLRGTWAYTGS